MMDTVDHMHESTAMPMHDMHDTTAMSMDNSGTMDNHNMHNHNMDMGGNMDMGDSMNMMHGMQMFFNTNNVGIHVLFHGWRISTPGQMAGSCIGVFLMAIVYEALKAWRVHLLARQAGQVAYLPIPSSGGVEKNRTIKYSSNNEDGVTVKSAGRNFLDCWHLLQSVLQVIQTTLSMFLMLVFMTFNVWLALCVSLGSGFGYYFFGWMNRRNLSMGDHCN